MFACVCLCLVRCECALQGNGRTRQSGVGGMSLSSELEGGTRNGFFEEKIQGKRATPGADPSVTLLTASHSVAPGSSSSSCLL